MACANIVFDWTWRIYICSAVAMFCILASALACKFSQLDDQLNDWKGEDVDLGVFGVRHLLVCQAVWQLEDYFQNVMLLSISCIFVGAINCSSYAYSQFSIPNPNYASAILEMVEVVVAFVLMDAICYVAECLKDKVSLEFFIFHAMYQIIIMQIC